MKWFKRKKKKKLHELSVDELKKKYVSKQNNVYLQVGLFIAFFIISLLVFVGYGQIVNSIDVNTVSQALILLSTITIMGFVFLIIIALSYLISAQESGRDMDICEIMIYLKEKMGE